MRGVRASRIVSALASLLLCAAASASDFAWESGSNGLDVSRPLQAGEPSGIVTAPERTSLGDPVGDFVGPSTPAHDLVFVNVQNDGASLVVLLGFDGPVGPSDAPGTHQLFGFIDFDLDRDPATGGQSHVDFYSTVVSGMGVDAYVDFSIIDSTAGTIDVYRGSGMVLNVGVGSLRFYETGVLVEVPLELLGLEAGDMADVATVIGPGGGPSDVAPNGGHLTSSDELVRLNQDRFWVSVDFQGHSGPPGVGHLVAGRSEDSAIFWFFQPDNWEVMVKVLDACGVNGHYWVFAAATTDVEYNLTVWDLYTGQASSYFNPLGQAAPAVTDTAAFATCGAAPP